MEAHEKRSAILPSDPLDIALSRWLGLPNGAHTQPSVTQTVDTYGNVTNYTVQTVRTELGHHVFVTVSTATKTDRFLLPPKVLALMARQADTVTAIVRRRHGKRLAEERQASGTHPVFTPAMRAKALQTRKAKAATRRARKEGK